MGIRNDQNDRNKHASCLEKTASSNINFEEGLKNQESERRHEFGGIQLF